MLQMLKRVKGSSGLFNKYKVLDSWTRCPPASHAEPCLCVFFGSEEGRGEVGSASGKKTSGSTVLMRPEGLHNVISNLPRSALMKSFLL
jgi:hypothetical protein